MLFRILPALLCFLPICLIGQYRNVSGTISEPNSKPLAKANVMAQAVEKEGSVTFAIADEQGRYRLKLDTSKSYRVSVSYIGYHPDTLLVLGGSDNIQHNFLLRPKSQQLKEIVIDHDYRPVIIKKDTIIFNVESFAKGNERKLKEVLAKLPGVEVDRDGRVQFNGQPIRHMLVEGKKFFGGGSKLAIENIPADALDQIEVIDHFNEVGFLKDVSGTDEMAMNVKLREDRKKFVFGDLEAGAGNKRHYLGRAAVFYYTPSHNVSVIGDINDIGRSAFTFDDMMRFQGGVSSYINTASRPSFTDLSAFTSAGRDVEGSRSRLMALNFSSDVLKKLNLSGFAIFSRLLTDRRTENFIQYVAAQNATEEQRLTEQANDDMMGLANLKLDYSPSATERLYYNAQWQSSGVSMSSMLNSITGTQHNLFRALRDAENHSLKQYVEWHRAYNIQHTTSFILNHVYEKSTPRKTWINDSIFLGGFIPIQADHQYHISQINRQRGNSLDMLFKHYWTINHLGQLTTNAGNNFSQVTLLTYDYQRLSDGTVNSFSDSGFGNEISYRLNDAFIGLDYRFSLGKLTNTASIFGRWFTLSVQQLNSEQRTNQVLVQPKWKSEFAIREHEKITFDYQYANSFPHIGMLNARYTLVSFNTVAKGNALLSDERYHASTLRYSRFTSVGGPVANAYITFNRKSRAIRNELQFEGINYYSVPILTDNPETNWTMFGSYSDKLAFLRTGASIRLSWFDYSQTVNSELANNRRISQRYTVSIRTAPRDWPQATLSYTKGFNRFRGLSSSEFATNELEFMLSWSFLPDWSLQTDYTYFDNRNRQVGTKDSYHLANATLNFQQEKSPWGVSVMANNLTNNRIKANNSISDFLVSEQLTYVMPRVIMLSLHYKL
jgi:Outer membrane receptor for ferrienterochelin and colicins